MNVFIGCSASNDIDNKYIKGCSDYLDKLFMNNYDLVFGSCISALMGVSYSKAKEHNRKVIGVCPKQYINDFETMKCDEEIVTENIIERTSKAIEISDVLLFLPGGIGTIYELLTSIECKRCHEFDKPIILYNYLGFYDKFLKLLDQIYNESFAKNDAKKLYHISNDIEDTLKYIHNYKKNLVK